MSVQKCPLPVDEFLGGVKITPSPRHPLGYVVGRLRRANDRKISDIRAQPVQGCVRDDHRYVRSRIRGVASFHIQRVGESMSQYQRQKSVDELLDRRVKRVILPLSILGHDYSPGARKSKSEKGAVTFTSEGSKRREI